MRKGSVRSWLRGFSTFLFVCIGAPALADVPAFINTEGLIVDEDGIPMDGVVDLAFAIYDVPEGGDALWTESHRLPLVVGYYTLLLGRLESLEEVFDPGEAYLGISIDGAPELAPRHPFAAVPFAVVADNAIGDITPSSIEVAGQPIIDAEGNWVGPAASVRTSLLSVDGSGSGLDADVIDGLDSTKFMRVDEDTGTSGALSVSGTTTMRKEGTALQLYHTAAGGHVKMVFHSRVNEGSDQGFLLLQDDSAQTVGSSAEDTEGGRASGEREPG